MEEKIIALVDEKLIKVLNKIQIPTNIDIKDNLSVLIADREIIDMLNKKIL